MRFNGKKLFEYVASFTKIITLVWLGVWIETILFSQIATIFSFGDVAAITTINDNVLQIGLVICSFYFSTKCIENVAKGIELYLHNSANPTENVASSEGTTIETEDEPEPISNISSWEELL